MSAPLSALRQLSHAYPNARFVLAVSGGRDSMALLELAATVWPAERLAVAHFNHALRGDASDGDEAFVRAAAARRGILFRHERGSGAPSEASCRQERLEFLERTRIALAFDFVVTAHHAGDQLETFLMRTIRGSGAGALGSMAPRRDQLLRPWLELPPSTFQSLDVAHREDATNSGEKYLRNRVRHHLRAPMEALAGEFGGEAAFFERFSAMTAELRRFSAGEAKRIAELYRRMTTETVFWTRFRLDDYLVLERSDRMRFLRHAYDEMALDRPTRERTREVADAIADGTRWVDLGNNARARTSCGIVFLQSASQNEFLERGPLPIEVDRGDLTGDFDDDIECRTVLPGDRYLGKKLKRLLLEFRVPEPERRLLPVLARRATNEVLWFAPLTTPAIPWKIEGFSFSFQS